MLSCKLFSFFCSIRVCLQFGMTPAVGKLRQRTFVLVDLIGLDKLTTAYGITTLVRGLSVLMGPPLAGKNLD